MTFRRVSGNTTSYDKRHTRPVILIVAGSTLVSFDGQEVPTMRKYLIFLVVTLLAGSAAVAQQPPTGMPGMHHPPGQMDSMNCQAMMEKMQSSAKAMDDRLQGLVDDMNKARGSAKVDRMAAVINELVSQRKQMREQMMTMMPQMMGHMMQHMQSGMAKGMAEEMKTCPMMQMKAQQPSAAAEPHH